MTKLIIQIPCYNEEKTLPLVLSELPKILEGIDIIETQIIDDGSTDDTCAVAEKFGVTYILKNVGNKGLGNSFRFGLDNALKKGADILINTDGDNQYPSRYMADLVKPILKGEAEIVVGDRQTAHVKHFSVSKKFFQWLGTKVTIFFSGEREVSDAVSGFRAYNKNAMRQINITSDFSYVLDSTVQAANKRLKMVSVPITTNPPTRKSRLFSNMFEHIRKSGIDIVRIYSMYKPLRLFTGLGSFFFLVGSVPIIRFLFDYLFVTGGKGMIQSLVIGGILLSISVNCFALGIIGDLMGRNRKLIEQVLNKLKDENRD